MFKRLWSYLVAVMMLPLHISELVKGAYRLETWRKRQDEQLQVFSRTIEYYDKFSESLKNMSSLYLGFKTEADYIRIRLEELNHYIVYGPDKKFSMNELQIERSSPLVSETPHHPPQGKIVGIQDSLRTKKP